MKLHIVRTRPANMNPAAAISETGAEVASYSFGLHSAHFGKDLQLRVANARAYLKRKRPISEKLRRMLVR